MQENKETDWNYMPDIPCLECGSITWLPCISMKKASKITSGKPTDELKQFPAMVCTNCNNPFEQKEVDQALKEKSKIVSI